MIYSGVLSGSFLGSFKGHSRVNQGSIQINAYKSLKHYQNSNWKAHVFYYLYLVQYSDVVDELIPSALLFFLDELGLINFRYQIILTRKSGVFGKKREKSRRNLSNLSFITCLFQTFIIFGCDFSRYPSIAMAMVFSALFWL